MSSTTHDPHHGAAMCEVPMRAGVHYSEVEVLALSIGNAYIGVGRPGLDVGRVSAWQMDGFCGVCSSGAGGGELGGFGSGDTLSWPAAGLRLGATHYFQEG